jgi:salicylate hydroxylase
MPSEIPAVLHLGAKISHIDVDNAKIELQDGSAFKSNLLIGADGIHLAVRTAAVKSAHSPVDSGWAIYRFLVQRDAILRDLVLSALKKENTRCIYLGTRFTH